jgi:hypothetical protein
MMLRDLIAVFRKVSPRNTQIYRSFYYERPQARNQRRREPGELRVPELALPSGRYAALLLPFESSKRQ